MLLQIPRRLSAMLHSTVPHQRLPEYLESSTPVSASNGIFATMPARCLLVYLERDNMILNGTLRIEALLGYPTFTVSEQLVNRERDFCGVSYTLECQQSCI